MPIVVRISPAGGNAVAFASLDDVLEFASAREGEAARFYAEGAAAARTESLRALLLELESEERRHKTLLDKFRAGRAVPLAGGPIADLGLTDALVEEPLGPEGTAQDVLIIAARREARAAELYARLAAVAATAEEKKMFEYLVRQERSHKLRLENEYEARVLSED
jgi:rubrerythrin